MPIRTVNNSNVCTLLRDRASKARYRIETTEASIKQKEALNKRYAELTNQLQIILGTKSFLSDTTKVVQEYVNIRKDRSMSSIYQAIASARRIIPGTAPMELKIKGESAIIVNERGDDINYVEGSALRATLAFLIRKAVLQCTNYIPLLILDEPLATLSPESSAELSKYIPLLAQDVAMILLEQKDDIFSNSNEIIYKFQLLETKTRVRRIEHGES